MWVWTYWCICLQPFLSPLLPDYLYVVYLTFLGIKLSFMLTTGRPLFIKLLNLPKLLQKQRFSIATQEKCVDHPWAELWAALQKSAHDSWRLQSSPLHDEQLVFYWTFKKSPVLARSPSQPVSAWSCTETRRKDQSDQSLSLLDLCWGKLGKSPLAGARWAEGQSTHQS